MFFLNFVDVSDLLDSSRCHLAATDPMAYHPTSSIQAHLRSQRQLLSEYATSFRAQEEVQGRRRDAAEVGIFSVGSLVVIKGRCREKLHHSPLVDFLLTFLLECSDLHGQFPKVALQRLEEQRVELEREIKEAKDALEQLRTEAAAVEHSLL